MIKRNGNDIVRLYDEDALVNRIYRSGRLIYQNIEALESSCIEMTATASQTITKPNGSNMEYSYDKSTWNTMSGAVEFGTSAHPKIYIRGKNTSGINASFTFGNTTSMVSLEGSCMNLLNWETKSTSVPSNGFRRLFSGATALASVSSDFLPATTLGNYCYSFMFYGTSLTSAPALPATTMVIGCYESMFEDCSGLTQAPALPAMSLADYCYNHLFRGCSSLTQAPTLPATTLIGYCYMGMFENCTALNEIHCYAPGDGLATHYWTNGVSSTGDFYAKASAVWGTGVNGIPEGWTQHLE